MVDPIAVEVIGNALMSAAEEMGMVLIKTAYSTNIKERRDCSTAIFDARGRTIVQAEHIPIHMSSLMGLMDFVLKKYRPEEIRPGDMFMSNDPYTGGGSHLPDISIAAPVFVDGVLSAFVANIAHHSDIGGKVAGSISGDCTSIFQEGLRIPPVRVMTGGEVQKDVVDMILTNCRTPLHRQGDLRAQFAANRTGMRRVEEIFRRYGAGQVMECLEAQMAYAERRFRSAIRNILDGVYAFTDYLDDDGITDKPVPIRVKIAIKGSRISLDFAGTGGQVAGGINVVYHVLLASVYYSLKAIVDPGVPSNSGFFRSIEVTAPESSIVNAQPPAAVAGRTDTCQRIADVIFGAMAKAVPDRVVAGCNSAVTTIMLSGADPERGSTYVYVESLAGGSGARSGADGLDGVQVHVTNTSNLPVECSETEYPLLVERYELIPGSGGAGTFRGGLAIRRDIRIRGHASTLATHGDRQKIPPWGLFGGKPGAGGRFTVNPGKKSERVMHSGKVSDIALPPGSLLRIETPGAGGYGPPKKRDRKLIERDKRDGKVL